jgi:hypothetical protein
MGVTVCLPLFGNPGRELEEGAVATGGDIRTLADGLRDRLQNAADVVDRLSAAGWSAKVAMFDLIFLHPQVACKEKAEEYLRAAGVDTAPFVIIEDLEEEPE